MTSSHRARRMASAATLLLLIAYAGPLAGQAPAKKPLPHDVYDSWKTIEKPTLSRDGVWLAYTLAPQDGDGELIVRNLNTGAEHRHPRGQDPIFTPDGAFVVFRVAPPDAALDKAKKEKKKADEMPKGGLGVLTLANGQTWTADRVKSFKVPEESSAVVAYLLEPPKKDPNDKEKDAPAPDPAAAAKKDKKEKKKDPGSPLLVRQLQSGSEATIADVTEYEWTKDGGWLAYGVSSKDPKADGAYARRTSDGTTRTLLSGLGHYQGFAFDEAGRQAAFVSDRDDYQAKPSRYRLYRWTTDASAATEIVSASTPGLARNAIVSEHGTLEFSKDGTRLFFGTAPASPPENDEAPEPIKVDLWHWKDPLLQTVQKVNAEQDRKRSYRAVLTLASKRVVQLATPDVPTIHVAEQGGFVLGESDAKYRIQSSWEGSYDDFLLFNLADGSSRTIAEKVHFGATLSPNGTYALYFDQHDNCWYSVRASDGRKTNLTGGLPVSFMRDDQDTPDVPSPYGVAGWTDGDRSVLLYDKFDIWEIKPDGTDAHTITNGVGRQDHLTFRAVRLDPKQRSIPASSPLLLSAVDQQTKASGFYRAEWKRGAAPVKLLMLDKLAGTPIKAKNADRVIVTFSRFEEFPDLWQTNPSFAEPKKISDANPQQAQYVWGRSELITYRNADGKVLQAVLTKPEDFDPAKKYPLMVYIYERLSDGLHRYVAPAPGTSINVSRYVSHGYVVLQPDIVYDTGYPGESALKCVVPAVQTVLAQGYIDPQRVGIQGHSWGGYQITYLITRTDIFRAVEAGASVSNMISAYGGIRWGTGLSRAFQYERTQSRIGGPPWEKPLQFIENSPIFWVDKVRTPYLTIHNDEDDAVPWYQGIEFFTAMRRLGKEAYLFSYNGEKHGLRERDNQKHWTVHMAEFFDHYLLGAPRPAWMDSGVPYLQRGTRDLTPFYGKPKTTNDDPDDRE
jgi:dienelactone hydrolase